MSGPEHVGKCEEMVDIKVIYSRDGEPSANEQSMTRLYLFDIEDRRTTTNDKTRLDIGQTYKTS